MPGSPAAKARVSRASRRRPRSLGLRLRRRRTRADVAATPGRGSARASRMSTTTGSKTTKVPYRCSFCGKSQEQVRKLIAGQGVYICDECINLCQEIIEEEMLEAPRAKTTPAALPSPRRIKEKLDSY